jgi:hypothetical protein
MLCDGLFEVNRFNAEIIFLGEISYLVYTIVARNENNLGPSLTDLLRLDFSRCKTIFLITLVFHGPEILGEKFCQTPIFLSQAAVANNVARILHGCRLLYLIL